MIWFDCGCGFVAYVVLLVGLVVVVLLCCMVLAIGCGVGGYLWLFKMIALADVCLGFGGDCRCFL